MLYSPEQQQMNITRLDLICLGRVSLDLFSQDVGAPFEDITGFHVFVGGTPLNIAVAAQRLGLQTALLTGTSPDAVGRLVRKFLTAEGVSTDYMFPKPGSTTNGFLLSIQPPHQFETAVYQDTSADLYLNVHDVMGAPVDTARAVLFTGIGLVSRSAMSASLLAAERCAAGGGTVYVDIDYKSSQWHSADEFGVMMRAALRTAHIAMGTEPEICAAAGLAAPEDAARSLLELVKEAVIIKRGAQGATVFTRAGKQVDAPSYPVDVLNVFGAGDAFAAGVIAGRLRGDDWESTLRLANACGALIVTRHGCANDMPTLAEVRAFLAQR